MGSRYSEMIQYELSLFIDYPRPAGDIIRTAFTSAIFQIAVGDRRAYGISIRVLMPYDVYFNFLLIDVFFAVHRKFLFILLVILCG